MWMTTRYRYFALVAMSHLALAYVLIFGTWLQITAMLALHCLNIFVAGTVTYHRLLAHRSWQAPRWFEIFGTLLGVFSFTGSSITRVLWHRQHHKYPDREGDPHSPWINNWWQQYFPMLAWKGEVNYKLVKDMMRDPFHTFIHQYYLAIVLGTFIAITLLFGLQWSIATVVAPGALSYMTVSLGNTFCHKGKNPENRACDNWFIILISFGDGWHGYHHQNPNDPAFKKGKFDPGFWLINLIRTDK